mgnify:CR=1 FL=1
MADRSPSGIPLSRIAQLTAGDDVLIGPDFYATITSVEQNSFVVRTEYGAVMRITAAAIHALP